MSGTDLLHHLYVMPDTQSCLLTLTRSRRQRERLLLLLLLLLLLRRRRRRRRRPQSNPHGSLSPANPVIHRCRQAVSGDPDVRLQQIDKCASLSSDAPFAMLRFPQNQIANKIIFAPPAMTAEPKAPLSNCGRDTR